MAAEDAGGLAEGSRAASRLRGLLDANQSIIADLSLEVVLERIVEAACTLLEARYGALGVLSPDGHGLAQFVHVGIDRETVARIGDLPQGKGVLGALIEQPEPITLHEVSADRRSVGFPPEHPPMHTFLGVPIIVRGEVFGNLYLTERAHGDFTPEDVELASAFAATAGIAIENARLFEDARKRQDWLRAAAEVSLRIVTTPSEDPLRVVAGQVQRLAAADVVSVVLPDADGEQLEVAVAVGARADVLEGSSYPLAGTLTEVVLATGTAGMVADDEDADRVVRLRDFVAVGPAMVLPLAGRDRVRGALVVGRLTPGIPFTEGDLEMASAFADQTAVALELAEARQDRERMQLFEERDRIARDLHDHVIQQLFAAGLTLQGISLGLGGSPEAERVETVVESLDDAIKQIRHTIFELRDRPGPGGARSAVLDVVASLVPALGFEASVGFDGPVDSVADHALTEDLVAVVREAVTNVARHARARSAAVTVVVDGGALEVRVADDGRGPGDSPRRSGLSNLAARAAHRGGTFSVERAGEGVGTVVRWSVPLPAVRGD